MFSKNMRNYMNSLYTTFGAFCMYRTCLYNPTQHHGTSRPPKKYNSCFRYTNRPSNRESMDHIIIRVVVQDALVNAISARYENTPI